MTVECIRSHYTKLRIMIVNRRRILAMKLKAILLVGLLLNSGSVLALTKAEIRAIIEDAYPGAQITEIEREIYQGKKIYEIDFKHEGEALEAIISLEGKIIHVEIDD